VLSPTTWYSLLFVQINAVYKYYSKDEWIMLSFLDLLYICRSKRIKDFKQKKSFCKYVILGEDQSRTESSVSVLHIIWETF